MAAILFYSTESFEQTDNTPSSDGPMWNLVKIGQAVSEKKTFNYYAILYMYIDQEQIQTPAGDKILTVTKSFDQFNHTL